MFQVELFCVWQGEISLCRVYKRAGVEDHPSLPRCLPTRGPSSSRGSQPDRKHNEMIHHLNMGFGGQSKPIDQIGDKMNETEGSSDHVTTALGLSKHNAYRAAMGALSTTMGLPPVLPMEEEGLMVMQQQQQQSKHAHAATSLVPACGAFFPAGPSSASSNNNAMMDDLNRLVSYQQQYYTNVQSHPSQFSSLLMQPAPMSLNPPPNPLPTTFSDRLWEWNPVPEANREYSNMSFK